MGLLIIDNSIRIELVIIWVYQPTDIILELLDKYNNFIDIFSKEQTDIFILYFNYNYIIKLKAEK